MEHKLELSTLTMPGLTELAARGLREAGVPASPEKLERLVRIAELLESWASRINLSGHRQAEAVMRRLVLDAVAMCRVLPPFASLADLGSGAGFPGLPISVLVPEARVLLVESRLRRHHFQRAVVRELGLERCEPILGRLEEAPPIPCQLVVAQAVAPAKKMLPMMLRWAEPQALLVIPGAATAPAPLETPAGPTGLEEIQVERYRVPLGGPDRTLWTARAGTS